MIAPKYLLAKYIPDLMRQEPRNIGVVLWSQEGVEARFIAEKEYREIDGRSIPSFVSSPSAYRQWIEYWREQISSDEIQDPRAQKTARKSSDQFLEVLKLSNKGNFVLADGGILMEPVTSSELPTVTNELFTSLVEDYSLEISSEITLVDACDEIIKSTNLIKSPYFKTAFPIECEVNGTTDEYTFSYAFQNGSLGGLYQRVHLPKKKKELIKKNVHETAWMFENVIKSQRIAQDRTAALVFASEEQQSDSETARLLGVLNSVTRVINLRTERSVITEEFRKLAAYPS